MSELPVQEPSREGPAAEAGRGAGCGPGASGRSGDPGGGLSYREAIQFLYGLRLFGAKFGLENSRRLAALAGHPERALRFIHVAGTNGKGSTCAMLEAIYRAAGLRVGLFTSPHLVSFRERMQVNRVPISEGDVCRLVEELRGYGDSFPAEAHPTFFEVVMVMGLRWFAEQGCEVVIWETGLGGRLDATNIVRPLASVITNIQYDHEKWLGHTLAEIAREKAGILKPGVPAVTGATEPEALAVIEEVARSVGAPLRVLGGAVPAGGEAVGLPTALPLVGEHQRANARLALATVELLQGVIPVDAAMQQRGLENVRWPGRFQVVSRPGGQTLILDGAHNPAGARVLRAALGSHLPGVRPTLVLGILADKDWRAMCEVLAPAAARVLPVIVPSERTASPQELAEACLAANPEAQVIACLSLADALRLAEGDAVVVVAGSLYLIGEALEQLGGSGEAGGGERDLNEWGAFTPVQAGRPAGPHPR